MNNGPLEPSQLDYQAIIKKLNFTGMDVGCIRDDFKGITYSFISLLDYLTELGIHQDDEVMEVVGILEGLGYKSPDASWLRRFMIYHNFKG